MFGIEIFRVEIEFHMLILCCSNVSVVKTRDGFSLWDKLGFFALLRMTIRCKNDNKAY